MRRVVTALIIVMVGSALAACGGAPADNGTTGTPAVTPTATPAPAAPAAPQGDINSPTQTVVPNEMFPTDPAGVPSSVLTALAAKRPLLVYFYDPTTNVSKDQRREIDRTMKKYRGTIDLIALDYTRGIVPPGSNMALDAETQKLSLLSAALKVNTTPYIVFVDAYGRITYRFAGFTDRILLGREVLRATQ